MRRHISSHGRWGWKLTRRSFTAIPHSNVDPSLFYKHISTVIPEPIRTRHLIAWCAKRAGDAALDRKGKGREDTTPDGDHLVKEIIEDLVASLGKGEVDTNVYSQVVSCCETVNLCQARVEF